MRPIVRDLLTVLRDACSVIIAFFVLALVVALMRALGVEPSPTALFWMLFAGCVVGLALRRWEAAL